MAYASCASHYRKHRVYSNKRKRVDKRLKKPRYIVHPRTEIKTTRWGKTNINEFMLRLRKLFTHVKPSPLLIIARGVFRPRKYSIATGRRVDILVVCGVEFVRNGQQVVRARDLNDHKMVIRETCNHLL